MWLGIVNSCVYNVHQTRNIYQVLPYSVSSNTPSELQKPQSKTVFNKYSFIGNKGHVDILYYRKIHT